MPLVENYRIPELRASIAKCEQRIAGMQSGTSGQIPAGFGHVNAARAQENQLAAQQKNLATFQLELIMAMLNSGEWLASDLLKRMEDAPAASANAVHRQIHGHLFTAGRHLNRGNVNKSDEHINAALQLVRSLPKETT